MRRYAVGIALLAFVLTGCAKEQKSTLDIMTLSGVDCGQDWAEGVIPSGDVPDIGDLNVRNITIYECASTNTQYVALEVLESEMLAANMEWHDAISHTDAQKLISSTNYQAVLDRAEGDEQVFLISYDTCEVALHPDGC